MSDQLAKQQIQIWEHVATVAVIDLDDDTVAHPLAVEIGQSPTTLRWHIRAVDYRGVDRAPDDSLATRDESWALALDVCGENYETGGLDPSEWSRGRALGISAHDLAWEDIDF